MTVRIGKPPAHLTSAARPTTWRANGRWTRTDPAPAGALVTADFQTSGRGRRGREWQAQAGQSALMSFVYRPRASAGRSDSLAWWRPWPSRRRWRRSAFRPANQMAERSAAERRQSRAAFWWKAASARVSAGCGRSSFRHRRQRQPGTVSPELMILLIRRRRCGWHRAGTSEIEAVIEAVSQSLTLGRSAGGGRLRAGRGRLPGASGRGRGSPAAAMNGGVVGLTDDGAAVVRCADGTFAEWTTVN